MPKWLWWFLEPFTIPQYKLTTVDGLKATLFIFICIGIIFGIALSIITIKDKAERWKNARKINRKRN